MTLLDNLPCAVLVTDVTGTILCANADAVALTGASDAADLLGPMEARLPPASRIFLQTHVWPTLLRDGAVREIFLQWLDGARKPVPVMLNARVGEHQGERAYFWTLFVTLQRSRFEVELLRARERAERAAKQLTENERFVKTLLEAMPGPVAYWDVALNCLFANKPYAACFGNPMDAAAAGGVSKLLNAQCLSQAQGHAHVNAVLAGEAQEFEAEVRSADGTVLQTLTHYVPDRVGDKVVGFLVQVSDVTALKRSEAALAAQVELMRVTLHSIGDAVITTDGEGHVAWLNPVAERLTGWLGDEARGRPLTQVFHLVKESTRLPAGNPVTLCLDGAGSVGRSADCLLLSRDGREFGIEHSAAPIRSVTGAVLGAVLVFHDVSEQRRMSGEMTYRATHDVLTGLLNRGEFEIRLARVLRKAHDEGTSHAMLYIDLDQFKLVNDACGHTVGDELLQQVSRLLVDAVRGRDTLARLGGDEFGIILENCSTDQASRVAQKVCDSMEAFRFVHEDRRFRIGTSIGLVPVDRRWSAVAAIQQAADTACYAAKEAGRNRVHTWFDTDAAIRTRHADMQWTTRIERALDEDGFVLFGQRIEPLKRAPSGLHAEVLLRLVNDDGSLAAPGAFLPAAERFNLITRVDRWVLRRVVAMLQTLPDLAGIETLCVNLSGQSVGDLTFHRWAIDLLSTAGAEIRARLCLEITETAAVTNLVDAASFIEQVRAAGVQVALDDFGAGASSFGYLKRLPVDVLKIDGQFIRDLVTDPLDDAAVRCFTDVARVVGMQTVAEFVDNAQVLERLREIGVDHAQGYLIHRPEPLVQLLPLASLSTV